MKDGMKRLQAAVSGAAAAADRDGRKDELRGDKNGRSSRLRNWRRLANAGNNDDDDDNNNNNHCC